MYIHLKTCMDTLSYRERERERERERGERETDRERGERETERERERERERGERERELFLQLLPKTDGFSHGRIVRMVVVISLHYPNAGLRVIHIENVRLHFSTARFPPASPVEQCA